MADSWFLKNWVKKFSLLYLSKSHLPFFFLSCLFLGMSWCVRMCADVGRRAQVCAGVFRRTQVCGTNTDGLLCFPFWWQSNFIKFFDGGLQYEYIRTFLKRLCSFSNYNSSKFPSSIEIKTKRKLPMHCHCFLYCQKYSMIHWPQLI